MEYLGKNHIKGGNTVGSDHHHDVVVDSVDVTHLAMIFGSLTGEVEIGLYQCSSHIFENVI